MQIKSVALISLLKKLSKAHLLKQASYLVCMTKRFPRPQVNKFSETHIPSPLALPEDVPVQS